MTRSTRTPALRAAPKPERTTIPPAPDEPVWAPLPEPMRVSMWEDFHSSEKLVHELVPEWYEYNTEQKTYTLPPFQRQWQWSAARCCDYLNSLLRGERQTPLALWHAWDTGRTLILDGQHRLASLGATIVDAVGEPRKAPPVAFDLTRSQWVPGEADGVTTFDRVHIHAALTEYPRDDNYPLRWRSDDFRMKLGFVGIRMRSARQLMTGVRLPERTQSWRMVVDYFDRLNRSVPFTEAELADIRAFVATLEDSCPTP